MVASYINPIPLPQWGINDLFFELHYLIEDTLPRIRCLLTQTANQSRLQRNALVKIGVVEDNLLEFIFSIRIGRKWSVNNASGLV